MKRSPFRPRRSKYGNRRVRLPGEQRSFDSKREAEAWLSLSILQKSGTVMNLRRQVIYPLEVNGVKICRYVADFVFQEKYTNGFGDRDRRTVVADAKGYRTPEYKIKKALMKAIHGIDIREL